MLRAGHPLVVLPRDSPWTESALPRRCHGRVRCSGLSARGWRRPAAEVGAGRTTVARASVGAIDEIREEGEFLRLGLGVESGNVVEELVVVRVVRAE